MLARVSEAAELLLCFFFFSSRRRHTRYIGDWSSDVCSSDLPEWQGTWRFPTSRACLVCAPPPFATTSRSGFSRRQCAKMANAATTTVRSSRSEERRVGKECRSRRSMEHYKNEWNGWRIDVAC